MIAGLPDDGLAIEERHSVRLVVLDGAGRILLFRTVHWERPEFGVWWELPGGGIEPGETVTETAIRELREETGIDVTPAEVSAPTWSRIGSFQYRGPVRRVQHEVVMTVRLTGTATVDTSGQMAYELEEYTDFRWWPVSSVVSSTARFYPGRLPDLIEAHLRGEAIEEGLEVWN